MSVHVVERVRSVRNWSLVLLAGLLFLSCKKSTENVSELKVLRYPLGSWPQSIEPAFADTGVSVFLLRQIGSTLLKYGNDYGFLPADAREFSWDKSGQKLTLRLQDGLVWTDGVEIKASHYRDSISYALSAETPSFLADLFFEIKGAREIKQGKAPISSLGVRANDAQKTLEIDVLTPFSGKTLHSLAYVISSPIRLDLMKQHGNARWMLPQDGRPGVSSGPFFISEFQNDRRIVLMKTKKEEGFFESVDMPLVKDPSTALAMYEKGDLDVLSELPATLMKKLLKRPDLISEPGLATYMIGFSLKKGSVTRDVHLRRALALSIDYPDIPRIIGGDALVATGWVPPRLIPSPAPKELAANLEKAKEEFALWLAKKEHGHGKKENQNKKNESIKLFINGGDRHQLIAERVANTWRSAFGINVEIELMEWKGLVNQIKNDTPALYRYAWTAVYPDPLFFLELFSTGALNNFGAWSNQEYDALLSVLSRTPVEKRDAVFWEKLSRAQEILVREDPALIPIYHYTKQVLLKPSVEGWATEPTGWVVLKNLRRKKAN